MIRKVVKSSPVLRNVKRWVFLSFLASFSTFSGPVYAETPVILYAQDIPANELIGLLYREIFRKPFVTAPTVQANRSAVSVHIEGTQEQAIQQASDYLAAMGFVIVAANGVDRVELPAPPVPEKPITKPFFYKAKWRDPAELANILKPLFPEARFSGSVQNVSSSGSIATPQAMQIDSLVVHATVGDLSQIRELLPRIDTAVSDLIVKAAVFEVGTDVEDGSAFKLAVGLLNGSVNIGVGSAAVAGGDLSGLLGSFVSISSSSVDAVVSALSTDSRFNLVTAPAVRARSGSPTSFSVGQSVPVLGSVSYPDNGAAVQSVEYRDAGVLFTVRPFVQEQVITLALTQEISDFVKTTTGVNNTPTLTKRAIDTTLSLKNGDVVMLGGLTRTKDADAREGFSFLPDFMKSANKTRSRSDLLLVLQVIKLDHVSSSVNFATSMKSVVVPVPIPRPLDSHQPLGRDALNALRSPGLY